MSQRQERNENYMGDPTKIAANHGTPRNTPSKTSANGISELPPLKGPNSYPKQGRINFGNEKIGVVP